MDMSVDFLKNVGAGVVARFRNGGVSLNDGIIKVAEANEMNADQVARLVETVNQLAYLSGPHGSMDKTAEFDLANTEQIMTYFLTPTLEKAASQKRLSPLALLAEPMEKVAAYEANIDPIEARKQLTRHFYAGRDQLRSMDVEEMNITEGLLKSAAMVSKDPDALMKIAALTGGDSKRYNELCSLVFGHVKEAAGPVIRSEDALFNVKALQDCLGLAKEASVKRQNLEEKLMKIAEVIKPEYMTKEAFIGNLVRAAGTILRGASAGASTAGKAIKLGGTVAIAGPEIGQIASKSAPTKDVWSSLHN